MSVAIFRGTHASRMLVAASRHDGLSAPVENQFARPLSLSCSENFASAGRVRSPENCRHL